MEVRKGHYADGKGRLEFKSDPRYAKVTVGVKARNVVSADLYCPSTGDSNNSSGDMASTSSLGDDHRTTCPLSFWTEPAGEEIAQTLGVIYLF